MDERMTRVTSILGVEYELDPAQPVQADMLAALHAGHLYEPSLSRFINAVLRPGDIAVDGGAHCGYFTKLMAKCVGPEGYVLAVEASPWNMAYLRAQVADCDNVHPAQWALAAEPGLVELYRNADNDGGHALWDPAQHPANLKSKVSEERVTVPTATLDRLTDRLPVRVVKLDIEGSEFAALSGFRSVLGSDNAPPFVVCEINRSALVWMGTTEWALRGLMAEYGYECWHLADVAPELRAIGPTETVNSLAVFNVVFMREGTTL